MICSVGIGRISRYSRTHAALRVPTQTIFFLIIPISFCNVAFGRYYLSYGPSYAGDIFGHIIYTDLLGFRSDVDKLKYIFHPRERRKEGNRRWFASIPLSFLPLAHSEQVGIHVRGP